MGMKKVSGTYRRINREIRRKRRHARSVMAMIRETLKENLGLRLAVYAMLLLAAVGSVIHMGDVNAAVKPRRDMKWYMKPGAVQIAAPPVAEESFAAEAGEETGQYLPEGWESSPEDEPEDDETPAEGERLAAGVFSLFPRALAEEQPNALPADDGGLAEDDAVWETLPEDGASEAEDEAGASGEENAADGTAGPENAGEDATEPEDAGEDLDEVEEPDGEAGAYEVPVFGEDNAEQAGFIIWDDGGQTEPEPTAAPKATARAKKAKAVKLVISAAGDCTLGGDVRTGGLKRFDKVVQKKGYGYFLSKVKSVFARDDLTIVNLEGPLTSSKKIRVRKMYTFRGRPSYAKILKAGSVEICNIANNHALDFDERGLKDTVKALNKVGIGSSGFGKVYTRTVKGVKVCSMGFTKWQYSARDIYKAVKAQRKKCDLLIVSIHWGEEGKYKTSKEQRKMGMAAIEAGADLVLGHHPHVFGGIEKYKGKYIVYSLSNFCFGGNRNPADKRTFIFQQTFSIKGGKVKDAGINILPCAVTLSRKGNDFRPAPLPKQRAKLLIKNIARYSKLKWSKVKWMSGAAPVKLGLVKKKKK